MTTWDAYLEGVLDRCHTAYRLPKPSYLCFYLNPKDPRHGTLPCPMPKSCRERYYLADLPDHLVSGHGWSWEQVSRWLVSPHATTDRLGSLG